MESFEELQTRLEGVWKLNNAGAGVEHVLIALPSFSVGESLLSHYGDRIPALEHRYLLASLMLHRIEACEMIFLGTAEPGEEVMEYYRSLVPADRRDSVRSRFHHVVVPDRSARSVAAKILDHPDLLDRIRAFIGERPVFIEPWNVTDHEVEVAMRLRAPINGTDPKLWPLGYKSSGRRLFREAGVPVPFGHEDVQDVDGVIQAIDAVRGERPEAPGVVVKLDNSGAGDGNMVLRFDAGGAAAADLRTRVQSLPPWFLEELRAGGIVEELIVAERFTSPSVQIDITPGGEVQVLATHEQVLGGESGQVYTGCRFPAEETYAAELARHGRAVAEQFARRGALGRLSVDFAVAADANGNADAFALEVNLRKGGTTHPYSALRNLAPGRYDSDAGRWVTAEGEPRWYRSTDNLIDEAWVGLPPAEVIRVVADAGLQFDTATRTGVVLHMLSGLAIDGRFGLTAIGSSREHAEELFAATEAAVPAARGSAA